MNKNTLLRLIISKIQEKIGFSYVLLSIVLTISMVLSTQKAEASSTTSTFYKIDVTNCIKCYHCEVVASQSISIDNDEYPYWIYGSTSGNYRVYVNPPQEYLEDLDKAIAECPMECISKSTHQKRR